MNPLSFESFKEYYFIHKRFPNNAYVNPVKTLNEYQLKSKYEKYLVSLDKQQTRYENYMDKLKLKEVRITPRAKRIQDAMDRVRKENPEGQEFWSKLNDDEKSIVRKNMIGNLALYDVAHIFGRGRSPHLADEESNMMVVPRSFHTYIDKRLNPFSDRHEAISEERANEIWEYLVGKDRWEHLQELNRNIKTRLTFDNNEDEREIDLLD